MAATERITMTMRELDRYKVIQAVADGMLKPWRAAERFGLTTRQIQRLVGRLREHGPQGLVSRRRSKRNDNRLDAATTDRALSIIRERCADFGVREALGMSWHPAGPANGQTAQDRCRLRRLHRSPLSNCGRRRMTGSSLSNFGSTLPN